ncbi:MAG: alpha-L-rhamnosidase C-terminal domain-containing protein [Acidimicrobiales bacterium]
MISFLHHYVGGLVLAAPGYRRVRIAPRPGGGITWARTHHDAPHGRISVEWKCDDDGGVLTSVLPEGTTGEIVLPDGGSFEVGPGPHTHSWSSLT